MNPLRLRPRFALDVSGSPDEVIRRLQDCQSHGRCPYRVKYFEGQVELKLPPERRHTWSPQLIMAVRPHPEGGASLSGRFGPMENIWTMFMALYGVTGFSFIGGVMLWSSELLLGRGELGRWMMVVSGLGFILTWGASMIGQSLGQGQIDELREFILRLLADPAQEAPSQAPSEP